MTSKRFMMNYGAKVIGLGDGRSHSQVSQQ